MEQKKHSLTLEFTLVLVMMAVSIVLGILIGYTYTSLNGEFLLLSSVTRDTNEGCKNLSLEDTAYCLGEEVELFFNYNISNIGADLSLDELKEQGGVCSHYADYYYDRLVEIGDFYAQKVVIRNTLKMGHVFVVMSNEGGYCNLDQRVVQCFKLGGDDE